MSSTNFIDGKTIISASWLNDIDRKNFKEHVSVKDFGATGNGTTDDTKAIQSALNSGAKYIHIPFGIYLITATLVIPNYVTLYGDGYAVNAGYAPTRILKKGNFVGIILNSSCQLKNLAIEGASGNNGNDGIQLLGSRTLIENVLSAGHAQDGLRIGGYSTDDYNKINTNLWRVVNFISRSNGRHGCYVRHENSTKAPNNNAGVFMALDAGYNGGDGIKIEETIDNQFYGICCQNNKGYGIHITNYAKGNLIMTPYLEANTLGDLILDSGADRNFIFGSRAGAGNSGYINKGSGNFVLGRYYTMNDTPLHESVEAYLQLQILERTTSGVWNFSKEATTRNLLIQLAGTTASGDVVIQSAGAGSSGLRFSTAQGSAALKGLLSSQGSLTFNNVPAHSSLDLDIPIKGGDSSYSFTISSDFIPPAGIMFTCFWDNSSNSLKVRCVNSTAAMVSTKGNFKVIGQKII